MRTWHKNRSQSLDAGAMPDQKYIALAVDTLQNGTISFFAALVQL